jgi:hypothetical protein
MAVAQTELLSLNEADAPHDRGLDQRVTLYQRTTCGCKSQGRCREHQVDKGTHPKGARGRGVGGKALRVDGPLFI